MTLFRRVLVLVVLALAAGSADARGQEVTIDELVRIALERAPGLRAERMQISAAEGEMVQAAGRANPMVMARRQQQLGGASYETELEVAVPLELSRRRARTSVAERQREATTLTVAERERQLAFAVRTQAGRVLATRRTLSVFDEALQSSRQMRELLERRASEGAIPQLDANLATLEMWRVEADRAFAVGEAEAALAELRALAGLPADAPVVLRESLEQVARAGALESAGPDSLVPARPDVREATALVTVAEARLTAARAESTADVTLFGGFGRMRLGFDQQGFDERGTAVPIGMTMNTLAVGANVMVPLWNRNRGAVAAAEAGVARARLELAGRELAAHAEIAAAVARTREARRAVELYAASIRSLAQRNADVILEAYELGRIPLTDLLDNQRRYLEIEQAYTETMARAYDAAVVLGHARGEGR